jgi:hypothetical protein
MILMRSIGNRIYHLNRSGIKMVTANNNWSSSCWSSSGIRKKTEFGTARNLFFSRIKEITKSDLKGLLFFVDDDGGGSTLVESYKYLSSLYTNYYGIASRIQFHNS